MCCGNVWDRSGEFVAVFHEGELTELTFHWRRLEGVWCHWGEKDQMKCMEIEQAYKEMLDDIGQIRHAM